MKRCPYCAEEIQDEAIVCRYCGKELAESTLTTNEPSFLFSFSVGLLILFSTGLIALFLALLWPGDTSSLYNFLPFLSIFFCAITTIFAVPGLNPHRKTFIRYLLVFVLSLIPVAGLITVYWAGKSIARKYKNIKSIKE